MAFCSTMKRRMWGLSTEQRCSRASTSQRRAPPRETRGARSPELPGESVVPAQRSQPCQRLWRFRSTPRNSWHIQVKQVARGHPLARKPSRRRNDRGDAPPRGVHSPHPHAEQVLTRVARLSREVRRLDAARLDEGLELRHGCLTITVTAPAISNSPSTLS